MINNNDLNIIIKNRCNVTMPNNDEDTVNRSKEGFSTGIEITASLKAFFSTVLHFLGDLTDFLFKRTKSRDGDTIGQIGQKPKGSSIEGTVELSSPLSEKLGGITESLKASDKANDANDKAKAFAKEGGSRSEELTKTAAVGFSQEILNISEGKQFKDQLPLVDPSEAETATKGPEKPPSPSP